MANYRTILVLLNVFICSALAQYTCEDFASEPPRNFTIHDGFEGIIESIYISDIEGADFESSSYLKASVNSQNYLTINTKKSFEDYGDGDHVNMKLIIACEDSDWTLDYHLNINRTRCSKIEFSQRNYVYMFFDTLPQDYQFDLTTSENVLVDCTKAPVAFAIQENDYFSIDGGKEEATGSYYATLTVKKDIQAPFKEEYNITVVDSQDPNNIAVAVLSVQILESDDMKFADSYYWGVIEENLEIVIINGPITMENVMYTEDIYFEIESDYNDFFDAEFDSERVHVFVKPDRDLQEINDSSVMLVLKAFDMYLETAAETIVMLNVTGEDAIAPDHVEDVLTTTKPESDAEEQTEVTEAPIEETDKDDDDESVDDVDGNFGQQIDGDNGNEETGDNDEQTISEDDEQQTNDKDEDDDQVNDGGDNQIDDGNDNQIDGDDDNNADDVGKDDTNDDIENNDDEEYEDDENEVVEINVPLRGFDFYIAHTKALTIMMVIICIFIILSAIIFLKSRSPYKRFTY